MEQMDKVVAKSVSLNGEDWAVYRQIAKDMGISVSAAIRYVRRDWQRMKREEFEQQHAKFSEQAV